MSVSVTLPALGESVTEGTVTRWLKEVGDSVEADEPLLEVSTDKVDTEIPSPAAGTLVSITAAEDETVEVGAELGVIGDSADAPAAAPAPAAPAPTASAPAEDAQAAPGRSEPAPAEDAQATPAPTEPVAAPTTASAEPAPAPAAGSGAPAASGHSTAAEVPGGQSGSLPASAADPQYTEGDSHPSGGATTSVTLPELGESVTEGTVTRWLKEVGDSVEADEPLLEVSTDKVDTEIPSPVAGTLLSITAAEDETVAVGAELAVIGAADAAPGSDPTSTTGPPTATTAVAPAAPAASAAPAAPTPSAPTPEPEEPAEPVRPVAAAAPSTPAPATPAPTTPGPTTPPATTTAPTAADGGSPYVTPLVRKLAADSGVDLSAITGTGVGGRIRKQDVQDAAEAARAEAERVEAARAEAERVEAERAETARAAAAPDAAPAAATTGTARPSAVQPSPLRGTTEKLSRLRRVIATRMVESLQTTAQLTSVVEVDVTAIARLRQRAKAGFEAREGVKLSFLPFFALATVEALKVMPRLNATLDAEAGLITYADSENLGIAVDTERGLLVPVITGAGDLNLAGIARRIADLAARTRTNKLSPDELAGGTFTLTNTGSRGALFDTPILNQPQVGILGTGAVVKRAVVIDAPGIGETIAVRSMAYLSLTYDHRLVDGADAARFLVAVKSRLEQGAFESEVGL